MAAWRAALAAGGRAALRGRLAGLRAARNQRPPPGWSVAAAALLGGGSLVASYGGRAGLFPVVLAQSEWLPGTEVFKLRQEHQLHFYGPLLEFTFFEKEGKILWMFGEHGSYLPPQGFTRTSYEPVTDPRQNIADYSRLNIELQKEDVSNAEGDERLSLRKHRFMHFASLEYEGEHYMTPRDFLFSVVFDEVERKASARKLTKKEVDAALLCVAKAKPGPTFFRELGDKGLISYAEYLFLLTILTKPQTGFQIAFKMLDTDGNEQVEKKEFFKLQRIIGKEDDLKTAGDETTLQGAELESCGANTMLLVHFFGKEGKEKLRYSEFFRFMENLQTEVQEMEFIKFSKGLNVMRKEDFAEWLLYFTDEENNEIYWQNVKDRIEAGENISLEEFKTFCKFTNNLEDFSIAMQMFTVANLPVKRAEFKRAVKVATGQDLSDNVLDTIFKIFDLDGDDCLSHSEFIGVLRNRIHRGLRVAQQQGIQGYWKCVKRESIKGAKELWKQTGKSPF